MVELAELLQPSIPVFINTIYAVLGKNFGAVKKFMIGTRCTVTKNYLCLATKIFTDKLSVLRNFRSPLSAARFTLCRA